jgi:hypothetical protein
MPIALPRKNTVVLPGDEGDGRYVHRRFVRWRNIVLLQYITSFTM